jgi:outer membrane protein insertion porin family
MRLLPLNNEKELPYPLAFFLLVITVGILSFPVLLLADDSGTSLPVAEASSPIIIDIIFQGNKVTRPHTMLQEMVLSRGDLADAEKVELCRQAIMDLNLFKSVIIEQQASEDGVVLVVTVEEKFFILPLPTLSRSNEGDISYGAYIKWYNMFGLNYTFKLSGKVKQFQDGDTDERKFIAYNFIMPRINSGPWELELYGDYSEERLYAPDLLRSSYQLSAWYTGLDLMRWLYLEGPSRGWFIRGSGSLLYREYELDNGIDGFYEDGYRPIISGGGGYKKVHDHLFSRTGKEFGYELGLGNSPVESEGFFVNHYFYYRGYHWLFDKPHYNLNFQVKGAFSSDSSNNEHSYKLGSGSTLRGYPRDSVSGNAYLQANVEYLQPLLGNPPIRGVLFADIGNAWSTVEDVDVTDLEACAGLGIRAKVKYFVKLDLVLEWAFTADGENKVYAGTNVPF